MKIKTSATPPQNAKESPTKGHYKDLLLAASASGVTPSADGRTISRGAVTVSSPGFSVWRRDEVIRKLGIIRRYTKTESFRDFIVRHMHESALTTSAGGWLASCSVIRDRCYGIDLATARSH